MHVTKYDFCSIFTLLLFKYFSEVKSGEQSEVSGVQTIVGMCLTQPGYGSGLLPSVYYCLEINVGLKSISIVLSLKYIFLILFFNLSKIFKQNFYSSKPFSQYFDFNLKVKIEVFFLLR